MAATNQLDIDLLRSMLHYDPETGIFTWRSKPSKQIKIGDVAGCLGDHGYILIRLRGVLYRAHRLAWFYVYGEWPTEEVDHINGKPSDNRLCNLREATRKQNMENRGLNANNSTGFRGVTFTKRLNKFKATLRNHWKTHNLGHFETAEEAAAVVSAKRAELFTHDDGRDRGVMHG